MHDKEEDTEESESGESDESKSEEGPVPDLSPQDIKMAAPTFGRQFASKIEDFEKLLEKPLDFNFGDSPFGKTSDLSELANEKPQETIFVPSSVFGGGVVSSFSDINQEKTFHKDSNQEDKQEN